MEDKIDCYRVSDISLFCNSRKKLTFEMLEIIMRFLIFYPVISNIIYAIYKNNPIYIFNGSIIIIYLVSINLIRIKLKKKKIAFILNIALVLSFFAIPFQEYEKLILGVYLILELLKSLHKFFEPNYKFYGIFFFFLGELILCINLFFSYSINNSYTKFLTILSALVFAFIFLFYLNNSRSTILIKAEKNYTFSNIKNLTAGSKKVLLLLLCIFLIVISLILLLTSNINSFINSNAIKQISTLFISANPYNTDNRQFAPKNSSIYKMMHPNSNDIRSENNSDFSSSHTYLILIIFITVIVCIFLYLLFKRLLKLKSEMTAHASLDTETVFLEDDLKKDLINISHKFNFNLSNKEKLRKKYKKLIKSYSKKGLKIKASYTTNELENEVSSLTKDNIKNCGDIYRKTRYSQYEPTSEDISKMK